MRSPLSTRAAAIFLVLGCLTLPSQAELLECGPGETLEVVTYNWKMKGFLSIFAGLRFPTKGTAALATHQKTPGKVETELRIVSKEEKSEFYLYQSEVNLNTGRTTSSTDGYSFNDRVRMETATFDYDTRKSSHSRKDTKHGSDIRTCEVDLPKGELKDVLTAIYFIRENADSLQKKAQRTSVFSAGKLYNVMITPGKTEEVEFKKRLVRVTVFTISAVPEESKKWPGDIEVWITKDARHLPLRIILEKKMASLNLVADGVFNCP